MQYNVYGSKRLRKYDNSTNKYVNYYYHDLMGTYKFNRTAPSRKKPKGWLSPTSFSLSTNSANSLCFDYFYFFGIQAGRQVTVVGNEKFGFNVGDLSFDSGLTSRAELDALLKLKDQHVNLSVAFAERAATAETIAQTATTLATAISRIRKLDVSGAKKALRLSSLLTKRERKILKSSKSSAKKASNLWLGLQYGWMPLLQDVQGSAEQLASQDAAVPDRYRATVKGKRTSKENGKPVFVGTPTGTQSLRFDVYRYQRGSMGATVRLDFYLENPALARASQLGITNPLSVAWELVPFSFVADWMYPIGDYVNAIDSTLGWTFRGGSRTERIEQITHTTATFNPGLSAVQGYTSGVLSGHGTYYRKVLNRTVYTSPPVPSLYRPKIPDFGGRRMMNALALLRQACK